MVGCRTTRAPSADTEDVVQDVFVRTLRGVKRFQHRTVGGLQAYLRQSVVNRMRDTSAW